MNRSILIVMCDFIILSVMSLSTGVDQFGVPEDQLTPDQWNKVALGADVPF